MSEFAIAVNDSNEWLEAYGFGGFASGTTGRIRTRRYHALLLAAASPPTDRYALVQGFVGWVASPRGEEEIWPQRYAGGFETGLQTRSVIYRHDPWPSWRIELNSGRILQVELFVPRGTPAVVLRFELEGDVADTKLRLRPLLSGRGFHATHHENPGFCFEPEAVGNALRFKPYPGVPAVLSLSNGRFEFSPDWYRKFTYIEEDARGLAPTEDLASPGVLEFDLSQGPADWILKADLPLGIDVRSRAASEFANEVRSLELQRRLAHTERLDRSAEAFLVKRGPGRSLIAGYPWFGDWGRDTFIALRGLCLARGDLDTAAAILLEWAGVVSRGMLPNRFTESATDAPEYNSVDAALWYVLAATELLDAAKGECLSDQDRKRLERAILEIVSGYSAGTRFGIRCTGDGLLAAGTPGLQLTWMDAKVGDWVVTPRIGKPVEIQALWISALQSASRLNSEYARLESRARHHFEALFWNEEQGCLYDVVDVDHESGRVDQAFRPNQIFAAGGLPVDLLGPARARRVVNAVEQKLWTPLGLRSLAPHEPGYVPRYRGGVAERDGAYHQGTAWPWLIGPFVEAWLKTRPATPASRAEAKQRFLLPLQEHLAHAGLDHVSEIADAEAPHVPRGCPFQAWSLGEMIRLQRLLSS
ncbi:MAG TPA: amylo-alpha-1,6-glucosidase [Polyangiaceae bacterium]|nr:amylo-alpha-1,6-glucosidase [Polyangiaceae bacterium]